MQRNEAHRYWNVIIYTAQCGKTVDVLKLKFKRSDALRINASLYIIPHQLRLSIHTVGNFTATITTATITQYLKILLLRTYHITNYHHRYQLLPTH